MAPALCAVVRRPVPIGFVSQSASPARRRDFSSMCSGSTRPVTAIPYFGSRSITVCPPATTAPASATLSIAPWKSRCSCSSGASSGQAAMFRPKSTSPPIAYTSDIAFAAPIAPDA